MKLRAYENFRENMREAMELRGLTIKELSLRVRTSAPYISRVLHGKNTPSLERADAIADALGTSLTALLQEPRNATSKSSVA